MRRLPRQRPVEVRTSLPTFPGPCSPARLSSTAGLCQAAARRVPGAAVGGAAAPAARGRADQVPAQGGQAGDAAQEGDEEEEAEGQVVSQGPVVLESKCAMVSITHSTRTHSASSQALALARARAIAGSHAAIACGVRTHPSWYTWRCSGCTGIGDRLDQAGSRLDSGQGGGSVGHYLELLGNRRTSTEDRGRDR